MALPQSLLVPQTNMPNRYIRSENIPKSGPKSKKKPAILETRNDVSYEFSKSIRATDEGTYEVVSIKDKYCSYAVSEAAGGKGGRGSGQKLLQF